MLMTTYTRKHTTYRDALELVRQLPLRDQRRLRAELAKLPSVHLVLPNQTPQAIQKGKLLAEQVRKELSAATNTQTLDETMRQLRGRSWS